MRQTRFLTLALFVATGLVMTGCMSSQFPLRSPVIPPVGSWYNQTSFPVDTTFGPNEIGSQSGTAKARSVLGLFTWGDCSVEAAANNGGIKQIDHVDADFFNVLYVYMEYKTMVYGKTADQIQTPTSKAPSAAPAPPIGG